MKHLETGLTLFYDLNQLGGHIVRSDTTRFEHRLSTWLPSLSSIPNRTSMEFFINYRNSREIAEFYFKQLDMILPKNIRSEIPVFSSGDVSVFQTHAAHQAYVIIANIIKKVKTEYLNSEIGIITTGGSPSASTLQENLSKLNIQTSLELNSNNSILVSKPNMIRGHERKVIIVCVGHPPIKDLGKAIDAYVAFSRARDRLFVVEILGN